MTVKQQRDPLTLPTAERRINNQRHADPPSLRGGAADAAIQRFGFSRCNCVTVAEHSETMELDCHVGCASSQ